ncbi:hypothetical protein KIN20_003919 [Parelaphostrongylus tenuis]|uniref:Uncharacterized protein n=1 Tax=Parelaphostrongylus tenuis TaxID=148309 RepID=A0AAD5MJ03_PARTN|nr:hypothetical protein KIN20_003919 [Parelaphostrongylus tenuis]
MATEGCIAHSPQSESSAVSECILAFTLAHSALMIYQSVPIPHRLEQPISQHIAKDQINIKIKALDVDNALWDLS